MYIDEMMTILGKSKFPMINIAIFQGCFLPSFGSFGQAVSEEKILLNRPISNKNCLWRPLFVNGSGQNEQPL
jgi:hypothetical protein